MATEFLISVRFDLWPPTLDHLTDLIEQEYVDATVFNIEQEEV